MSPDEELEFRKRPADEDEDELRKEQGIEVLGEALRMRVERAELLDLCKQIYEALDDVYDVDQPIDGPIKEYPFSGAGLLMDRLRIAINFAEER